VEGFKTSGSDGEHRGDRGEQTEYQEHARRQLQRRQGDGEDARIAVPGELLL